MSSVMSTLVTNSMARAVDVVTDFAPLFYLIVGLSLAMWIAAFVRKVLTGGD